MDRFNPDADQKFSSAPVGEQVPDSSVHHGEKPDFPGEPQLDKTITDALAAKGAQFDSVPQVLIDRSVDEGLILPSEQGITSAKVAEKEKQPMGRGKRIGIAIGAAAGALAVAVPTIIGITSNANNTDRGTAPEKNPKDNSQVDNNKEKPPVVEKEKTPEELTDENKIEAGLSAEDYAKAFEGVLDKWALSGATDSAFREWVDSKSKVDYEDTLAASQTAQFAGALFAPGNEDPGIANATENLTTRNSAWIALWMRSYDFNKNTGTLKVGSVIDGTELVSENPDTGERVVHIWGHSTNNATSAKFTNEENRQKAIYSNGESWNQTLTLKVIDGKEYVTKWEG